MRRSKLMLISLVALCVCIGSAIYAAGIPAADADMHPDWDNFGQSVWITALVTLPAFCVFFITAISTVLKIIRKK